MKIIKYKKGKNHLSSNNKNIIINICVYSVFKIHFKHATSHVYNIFYSFLITCIAKIFSCH